MSGKIDKINSIYENILASIDCKVDEEGRVCHHIGDTSNVVSVKTGNGDERKPLYLPTNENLADSDLDCLFFHPLADTIMRGESPVIQWFKQMIILKITLATTEIGRTVLIVGATGNAMELPGEQLDVISRLSSGKDIKEQLCERWPKLMYAASGSATVPLVSIFIKRDAIDTNSSEIDAEKRKFKRAAIVSMPLIKIVRKAKVEKEGKIVGVDFAGYEIEIVERLLSELFPDGILDSTFSVFSNTSYAPSFTVLLQAHAKILNSLNKVRTKFHNQLPEGGPSKIVTDWVADIADFPQYTGIIPDLVGNNAPRREDVGMATANTDPITNEDRESNRRYRESESRYSPPRREERRDDYDDRRRSDNRPGVIRLKSEVETENGDKTIRPQNQDIVNARHREHSHGDGSDLANELKRERERSSRERDRDRRGRRYRDDDYDDDYDDRRYRGRGRDRDRDYYSRDRYHQPESRRRRR